MIRLRGQPAATLTMMLRLLEFNNLIYIIVIDCYRFNSEELRSPMMFVEDHWIFKGIFFSGDHRGHKFKQFHRLHPAQ